jgi:peptidyl-tRNA hydrolase, PTH1 family
VSDRNPATPNRFLIVGLGNPGRRYEKTRHNLGFLALDRVAEKAGCSFKFDKSNAELAITTWQGQPLLLVKPQTFMNLSGQAVAALVSYYKIDLDHVLVVLDDNDLALGRIRLRFQGSAGGHKGLKSIIDHLGTMDFSRLRIGIGSEEHQAELVDFVLSKFSKNEWPIVDEALDKCIQAIACFVQSGINAAMNQFNQNAS